MINLKVSFVALMIGTLTGGLITKKYFPTIEQKTSYIDKVETKTITKEVFRGNGTREITTTLVNTDFKKIDFNMPVIAKKNNYQLGLSVNKNFKNFDLNKPTLQGGYRVFENFWLIGMVNNEEIGLGLMYQF